METGILRHEPARVVEARLRQIERVRAKPGGGARDVDAGLRL